MQQNIFIITIQNIKQAKYNTRNARTKIRLRTKIRIQTNTGFTKIKINHTK